jgi:hypothetical protein
MTVSVAGTVNGGSKTHAPRGVSGNGSIILTPMRCGKVATGSVEWRSGRPVKVTCRGCLKNS